MQDFPEIATSLKFFNQNGRFDVICSGSLLRISYKKIESNSVGNKTDYIMQSMDFEEFLIAKGYGAEIFSDLLSHMKSLEPFNETTINVISKLFLDYCILGGMPEVVCSYIEKGTFEGTLDLQKSLVPLEVKSENGRTKSMRTLIASEKYPDITTGIKLCNANIGFANSIYMFPYFCTFLLKEYLREVELFPT